MGRWSGVCLCIEEGDNWSVKPHHSASQQFWRPFFPPLLSLRVISCSNQRLLWCVSWRYTARLKFSVEKVRIVRTAGSTLQVFLETKENISRTYLVAGRLLTSWLLPLVYAIDKASSSKKSWKQAYNPKKNVRTDCGTLERFLVVALLSQKITWSLQCWYVSARKRKDASRRSWSEFSRRTIGNSWRPENVKWVLLVCPFLSHHLSCLSICLNIVIFSLLPSRIPHSMEKIHSTDSWGLPCLYVYILKCSHNSQFWAFFFSQRGELVWGAGGERVGGRSYSVSSKRLSKSAAPKLVKIFRRLAWEAFVSLVC